MSDQLFTSNFVYTGRSCRWDRKPSRKMKKQTERVCWYGELWEVWGLADLI